MRTIYASACCILVFAINIKAQTSNTEFDGYVSGMPYQVWQDLGDSTVNLSQVVAHNRLNFHVYPSEHITASIQIRNQLLSGDFTEMSKMPDGFETDAYFLPLSYYKGFDNRNLLYLNIDRLWVQYVQNNFEVTVGRQRINWGQAFVWNPNDIFNSYNFFDFDYQERAGADAIRLQYYTGMTSSVQLAAKIDSANNLTMGGLFRFNKQGFDLQLLSGYTEWSELDTLYRNYTTSDFLLGAGWSGDIAGMSFRGELSYFIPIENKNSNKGLFVGSFAFDKTFSNESYASIEFLYQQNEKMSANDFYSFYTGTRTAKKLSITRYNFVGQFSYPVIPSLLNLSMAGMYFFQDTFDGLYMSPNISWSAFPNFEVSAIYQYFIYKDEILTHNDWIQTHFLFGRVKWNF